MTFVTRRRLYINPYKIILRKKIIDGFEEFSKGNYQPLLSLYADNVRQKFEGDHALGGERHDKQKVEEWFKRFVGLLPSKFTIHDVYVIGWPWDTIAAVKFEDYVTPKNVEPYINHGVMIAKIK